MAFRNHGVTPQNGKKAVFRPSEGRGVPLIKIGFEDFGNFGTLTPAIKMKTTGTYLRLGRLALAVALIVASSGFTMVLHSCLMEDMACCTQMASERPMPSPSGASSEGPSLVKLASSCCDNTIVGGLNPTTATLESQKAPVQQKILLIALSPEFPDGRQRNCPSFVTLRHFRTTYVPPTAIYLSNAALLI